MNKDIYELYKLVGNNIKNIRNKNNDTQEVLSEKIGMSRSFLSQIEGKGVNVGVSLDTLFFIAQAYNIDITELFEGYKDKFLKS